MNLQFLRNIDLKSVDKKSVLITVVASVIGLVAGVSTDSPPDIEGIKSLFGEATQNELTKLAFLFTAAAWIHSTRVKKEIKENFTSLTTAINEVATAFREDLKNQGLIVNNLALRITTVESLIKNNNKEQADGNSRG